MSKQENPATVNFSYTSFFLLSTIVISFVLTGSFGELRNAAWYVVLLYALVLYFLWDLVRQFYNAGQALAVYALAFIVLPFTMNALFDYSYGLIGFLVLLFAQLLALIMEFVYEVLVKGHVPKAVMSRLLAFDSRLDKSMVRLSTNHVYLTSYRGFVIAAMVVAAYLISTYLLLA